MNAATTIPAAADCRCSGCNGTTRRSPMLKTSLKELLDEVRTQGFAVEESGRLEASGRKRRFRIKPPDRNAAILHLMIEEEEGSIRKAISELRRRGFQWPPHQPGQVNGQVVPLRASEPAPAPQDEQDEQDEAPASVPPAPASATVASAPPAPPSAPPSPESEMDRLFGALKEARLYAHLAHDDLDKAERALTEAARVRDAARVEAEEADRRLRDSKASFDDAFGKSEAP